MIASITFSLSSDNVLKSISTNTGLKPVCIIADMSDTQFKGETITSPPFGYLNFKQVSESKLADEPEFTNTL